MSGVGFAYMVKARMGLEQSYGRQEPDVWRLNRSLTTERAAFKG